MKRNTRKKYGAVLCAVFLALILCACDPFGGYRKQLEQGRQQIERGQYEAAVTSYSMAANATRAALTLTRDAGTLTPRSPTMPRPTARSGTDTAAPLCWTTRKPLNSTTAPKDAQR